MREDLSQIVSIILGKIAFISSTADWQFDFQILLLFLRHKELKFCNFVWSEHR